MDEFTLAPMEFLANIARLPAGGASKKSDLTKFELPMGESLSSSVKL